MTAANCKIPFTRHLLQNDVKTTNLFSILSFFSWSFQLENENSRFAVWQLCYVVEEVDSIRRNRLTYSIRISLYTWELSRLEDFRNFCECIRLSFSYLHRKTFVKPTSGQKTKKKYTFMIPNIVCMFRTCRFTIHDCEY